MFRQSILMLSLVFCRPCPILVRIPWPSCAKDGLARKTFFRNQTAIFRSRKPGSPNNISNVVYWQPVQGRTERRATEACRGGLRCRSDLPFGSSLYFSHDPERLPTAEKAGSPIT